MGNGKPWQLGEDGNPGGAEGLHGAVSTRAPVPQSHAHDPTRQGKAPPQRCTCPSTQELLAATLRVCTYSRLWGMAGRAADKPTQQPFPLP